MAGSMSLTLSFVATFSLVICFAISLFQMRYFFSKYEAIIGNHLLLSTVQFISCFFSFLVLIYVFLTSNFDFQIVYSNSHTEKPFLYKLSGAWGNHEGSLLMWILILTIFNFFYAISNSLDIKLRNKIIASQSFLILGFLSFCLFMSSPFILLKENVSEGLGLNPILQDPLLAIHPPVLYLGYVGFSLVFSFAIGGMLNNKVDKEWASALKPWILIAWVFLTLGIALGSFWAYYELGWGGYWFWDPVENASLMPWLSATALLHCIIVLEKKDTLQSWTILLSILTFSLSLIGTFLVRSGILNSVHTFASDPGRGLFILLFLAIVLLFSFSLFASKGSTLEKPSSFGMISRESGILVNNWLLLTILFIVFLGTIYPLFIDLILEKSLTVGPQYYVVTIVPIVSLLLIFMTITPLVGWGKGSINQVLVKIKYSLIFSLTLAFAISLYFDLFSITQVTILFLSFSLIITTFFSGIKFSKNNFFVKSILGRTLSHAGFGLFILSVIANATYSEEKIYDAKVKDILELKNHQFIFEKVKQVEGENYNSIQAVFSLLEDNKVVKQFTPEIRFYDDPPTATSETSIVHGLFSDIYIVMNVPQYQDSISVRIHVKPFMNFIWLGVFMIISGGLFSIIYRIKNQ